MFDSLKYAKMLERSGITRKQAEAHMQILTNVMGEDVATKHDIAALKHDIVAVQHDITSLNRRIDDLELRMDRRFISLEEKMKQGFKAVDDKFEEKFQTLGYKLQMDLMIKLGGLITFLFGAGTALIGLVLT